MAQTFRLIIATVRQAGWAPVLVFLLHLWLAWGLKLYKAHPWIDIPMHLLGGVAISYFLLTALRHPLATDVLGQPTPLGQLIWIVSVTTVAAVVWEFAEWIYDRLRAGNAQIGGDDTMLDLLLGMVAALLVSLAAIDWKLGKVNRPVNER